MKYRRRKVGTYRKRKTYRKRRVYRRKARKSDGSISLKLYATQDLIYNKPLEHSTVTVNWANGTNNNTNEALRFIDVNEWKAYNPLYNQYKVTGVKLKYIPFSQVTKEGGAMTHCEFYSNVRVVMNVDYNSTMARSAPDFMSFPANR